MILDDLVGTNYNPTSNQTHTNHKGYYNCAVGALFDAYHCSTFIKPVLPNLPCQETKCEHRNKKLSPRYITKTFPFLKPN